MDAGQAGQPGQLSDQPASGGPTTGQDACAGEAGGAGAVLDGTQPSPGVIADGWNSGGGGGGVGRIRLNSLGTPTLLGTLSPAATTSATTVGLLPVAGQ